VGRRFSVYRKLTADPGASGEELVYAVEPARRLKLDRVVVAFPPGSSFELEVALLRGLEQIAPSRGAYSGDGFALVDELDVECGSGDRILLRYRNLNPAQARSCGVLLCGVEE